MTFQTDNVMHIKTVKEFFEDFSFFIFSGRFFCQKSWLFSEKGILIFLKDFLGYKHGFFGRKYLLKHGLSRTCIFSRIYFLKIFSKTFKTKKIQILLKNILRAIDFGVLSIFQGFLSFFEDFSFPQKFFELLKVLHDFPICKREFLQKSSERFSYLNSLIRKRGFFKFLKNK